jgi:hypothetical protein
VTAHQARRRPARRLLTRSASAPNATTTALATTLPGERYPATSRNDRRLDLNGRSSGDGTMQHDASRATPISTSGPAAQAAGATSNDALHGTVAGLESWLRQVAADHVGYAGYQRATLSQACSTWRSVRQALRLPARTPVMDLDLDDLVSRFHAVRPGFRSAQGYRTRLRLGRRLYTDWLSADPSDRDTLTHRCRVGPLDARGVTAGAPVATVAFPLRGDLSITVQYPLDLRSDESDRICMLVRSMIVR